MRDTIYDGIQIAYGKHGGNLSKEGGSKGNSSPISMPVLGSDPAFITSLGKRPRLVTAWEEEQIPMLLNANYGISALFFFYEKKKSQPV